ncbi:hypothetical protein Dimus_026296 [Dionaea muscipula]
MQPLLQFFCCISGWHQRSDSCSIALLFVYGLQSILCRRSQFLRQDWSPILHADKDGDPAMEGFTKRWALIN